MLRVRREEAGRGRVRERVEEGWIQVWGREKTVKRGRWRDGRRDSSQERKRNR